MTDAETTTTPTKPWYLSKTYIGLAVVAVSAVLRGFDVEIAQEDITEFTQYLVEGVGLILAIIGRATATKRLTR